jgi:hypothetical protein
MPGNVDSGNDTSPLFRPSKDETRPPHIDTLLDTPREIGSRPGVQLGQQGNHRPARAPGGRVLDRCSPASANAVPMLGCSANGTSVREVKMRTSAV